MPDVELRVADEFIDGPSNISSAPLLARIRRVVEQLRRFPEMGSPDVRPSLSVRYGAGLRNVAVSSFPIVFRFDGLTVDVLALVYGPSVS